MKRRTFTRPAILGTAGVMAGGLPAMAQQDKFGSKELIAAAEKEGGLTYYTANFAEVEQEVIKEFNKPFPKIKVAMVRAPGGQLITRIKTEAAAGKLAADVINHSDRGLMLELLDLFQDYTPPNAADYRPDALVSPKLWPGVTLGWAIAYNTAAGEERAQDLDGSHQARIQGQADRPGGRPVGRHDLDARHVRAPGAGRGLLGEAGGARHRAVSVGRAALRLAGARRGLDRAAALQHHLHQDRRGRAGRGDLRARGRADHPLRRRHSQDRPRTPTPPSCS